jgi:hypothetical protein
MSRQGWYLFANQNSEKPQERDDRGRWGAHMQESVEDPYRKTHDEADKINLHD